MFSFDYFVTGKEISHRDLPPVFSFAVQLRSVTEIAPKSPLLCVKRIPIRCDFRADAKAKRTVSLGNHVLGKPQVTSLCVVDCAGSISSVGKRRHG